MLSLFVVVDFDALAQASDIRIDREIFPFDDVIMHCTFLMLDVLLFNGLRLWPGNIFSHLLQGA